MLLPDYANGDLSAVCVWPDQVRHWYKYRWTSPLHFIDTPDQACNFNYQRDCHDSHGVKDMCVAGAIRNFTNQLSHYRHGTSDRRHNMTEALLFLAHFMGDIHQPMHVGFTSDEGGNTIELRWFRHKSNLHHVMHLVKETGAQAGTVEDVYVGTVRGRPSWYNTDGQGARNIKLVHQLDTRATKDQAQKNSMKSITVQAQINERLDELEETPFDGEEEEFVLGTRSVSIGLNWHGIYKYFDSRMPVVMKRIAQGGVRLAMILNHVFSDMSAI
ncbi:endonuclease precursor-like [Dorcoceras hygrometricum]|nr:endonuclease precursor-like [Dorcoceras hygrometricum]